MAHRTCVSVCDGEISGSSSAGIVESSAQFASGKKEGSIRELEKIEKGFSIFRCDKRVCLSDRPSVTTFFSK